MMANYDTINLKTSKTEILAIYNLYQENFPFWFGPFLEANTASNFRVGNRVMNVNSTMRKFIPFGARGTVVGKTEDKVIVQFDDQFLQGSEVYGHCGKYRGAIIEPNYILNLTRQFAMMMKDDFHSVKAFHEKPLKGKGQFIESGKIVPRQVGEKNQREQLIHEKHGDVPLNIEAPVFKPKQGPPQPKARE